MSPKLHNIAIAGATGSLGKHILASFLATGAFNITVLSRNAASAAAASLPAGVTIKQVDYYSPASLAAAFAGQDAVVNAIQQHDAALAVRMVDAAADAGVRRYVPPDFGGDPDNQGQATLPAYHAKAAVYARLRELAAAGRMEYTLVANGSFLELCLATGFYGIHLDTKKIELFGGEETSGNPHAQTSMPAIGAATAQALLKADETRNRVVYISSFVRSQRQLADLAKLALRGDWEETTLDIKGMFASSMEEVKKGNFSWEVLASLIKYTAVAPESSYAWGKSDNELLGVHQMTDDEIIAVIKKLAA